MKLPLLSKEFQVVLDFINRYDIPKVVSTLWTINQRLTTENLNERFLFLVVAYIAIIGHYDSDGP